MAIEVEVHREQTERGWLDKDGFVAPIAAGEGPRIIPRGAFPTGPAIGSPLPEVRCLDADGAAFDLHLHRAGGPAILVFFRSAVW